MYKQAQEALQGRLEKLAIGPMVGNILGNAAEGLGASLGMGRKAIADTGLKGVKDFAKADLAPTVLGKGKNKITLEGGGNSGIVNKQARAEYEARVRAQIALLRKIRREQSDKVIGAVDDAANKAAKTKLQAATAEKLQGVEKAFGGFQHKVKNTAQGLEDVQKRVQSGAAKSQANSASSALNARLANPWVGRSAMIGGGLLGGGLIGSAMSSDPRSDNGQYA